MGGPPSLSPGDPSHQFLDVNYSNTVCSVMNKAPLEKRIINHKWIGVMKIDMIPGNKKSWTMIWHG